jgi:hypothetical protein
MASHAYCTVTRVNSVQTIKDTTPRMLSFVELRNRNITVTVYMGLVPMSPKTRPSALIIPLFERFFSDIFYVYHFK